MTTPDDSRAQVLNAASVARLPRQVVGAVAGFLARWALRLVLPVLGAAGLLRAVPYQADVLGVPFQAQGSLFGRPGLSADTTLGNWEFPHVSGLPFGVHLSPRDVDLLALARAANGGQDGFVAQLRKQAIAQVPRVAAWLIAETLLGIVLGLAVAATIGLSVRYLRGLPRRRSELRRTVRLGGVAVLVTAVVAGYGVLTFDPNWVRQSQLTGTLAAAQLFPSQLSQYYQQSKAGDVIGSVIGIQESLQASIEREQTPDTAFRVMFVSDLHLAAVYPLIGQYAAAYGVSLIVNTGDEAEFGTREELTPDYLAAVAAVTATTPMLWLAGNHDSPVVAEILDAVPGVTVLGDKQRTTGGYRVEAGVVRAFGLTIAGLPDPRVYGAAGDYGSDDRDVVDPLEQEAVQDALAEVGDRRIDVFATHEPVQAAEIRELLGEQMRQTVSGHVHAQNDPGELQTDGFIDLVEGSTGAGGLDNIVRGADRPPIEFSIESVGAGCEFTGIQRFQIRPAADVDPDSAVSPAAYGTDVTTSTVYFQPQQLDADRSCGTELGISAVARL